MQILRAALLAASATVPSMAVAQDWQHTAFVYMIGASIDGTAGVGPVIGDVDVGFSDILENLEAGLMAGYRGENGPWAVMGDLIYMDLEADKDGLGPVGQSRTTVELDQLILEVDGARAITERLDAYVGLRYWDVDSTVVVVGGGPLGQTLNGSLGQDWVDLLLGLRYELPLGQDWTFVVRGDIAPMRTGADMSWHSTAMLTWRLGEHATALFGYRHLDVDYDDGQGASRFLMDVAQGGPSAGFAWRF